VAISAVCFDIGGVLIRISFRWSDVAVRLGVPLPANVSPDALLTDCEFFNRYQCGELDDDGYLGELSAYLGGVGPETARRVHNAILLEPYPGVDRLVLDLKAAGVLTGCMSNTNEPHWIAMTTGAFPANDALEVRIASHRVGMQKPDEAIFREFERQAGKRPDEIMFFDDSAENCAAARSHGWMAEAIDPSGDTAGQMRRYLRHADVLA
jgi:glucose-1-phosphatase